MVVVSARRRCSTPAGVAPEGSESAGDSRRVGKSPGQGVQLARGRGTRGRGSITCSPSSSAISSDRRRGRCWEMESGGTRPVPEATRGPEVIREELGSRRTSRSVLVHLRWSLPWRSFFASGRRLPVLWTHSVSFSAQLFRPARPKRASPEKSSWISAAQVTSLLPLHLRACPPEVIVQADRGRVLGGQNPGVWALLG